MPALFTRTSIGPASSSIRSKRVATCVGVREVGGVGCGPELGRDRPEGIVGAGNERDRGPDPGEGVGEGLADAS